MAASDRIPKDADYGFLHSQDGGPWEALKRIFRRPGQDARTADIIPFPRLRIEPKLFPSYPGYAPGQLKGNEILFVNPQITGRTNAQLFQTTTGDIAALAAAGAEGITASVYVGSDAALTLPATQNLLTVLSDAATNLTTIHLPEFPAANLYCGIKDRGYDLTANPIVVDTTDGNSIWAGEAVSSLPMGITGMALWFLWDGEFWDVL